jgi:hypothetical protein
MQHIVMQSPGYIASDMDGEKVMLCVGKGKYYNLGAVGGDIWDQLSEGTAVYQLVDHLMGQYEIERETCEQHVQAFLEELLQEGLILITAGETK